MIDFNAYTDSSYLEHVDLYFEAIKLYTQERVPSLQNHN